MLESYYNINNATGISINISKNGDTQICGCQVTIDNYRLNIEKKIIDLSSVEELIEHIPAKAYIAINISGKGVLQKQIERVAEINANNFAQILPNAKFEDFYTQNFISGSFSFISIIRKTDADKWINTINDLGYITLLISLGPFPIQNIEAQLNMYGNEIVLNGHIIQRNENNEWLSYKYNDSERSIYPIKIESEPIDEKLIIAYSNAFQLVLANKLKIIKVDVPALGINFQKLLNDKKLQVKGFVILSVFFILLLINFILLIYFNASNFKLSSQLNQSTQSISNMQGLDNQVKVKESLIKDLGWDGGVNKSRMIDQLATLLPTDMSLNELVINPIDPITLRSQKSLQFIDNKIRVIGNASKIVPVNEWVARIKVQKWVKNVQLDSYVYNNELNTGQFVIIIDY